VTVRMLFIKKKGVKPTAYVHLVVISTFVAVTM